MAYVRKSLMEQAFYGVVIAGARVRILLIARVAVVVVAPHARWPFVGCCCGCGGCCGHGGGGLLCSLFAQADKPSHVWSLEDCTLQLAHLLTGTKNTFTILNHKRAHASTYWKCESDSELVHWLTVLRVRSRIRCVCDSPTIHTSLSLSLSLSLSRE